MNYFSNPDVEYLDKPTGTGTENNARTIEDNMVRRKSSASLNRVDCHCFGRAIENRLLILECRRKRAAPSSRVRNDLYSINLQACRRAGSRRFKTVHE